MTADGNNTVAAPEKRPARRVRGHAGVQDGSVGKALRSAYQQTVGETVPADLLDLLGKLD